MITVTSGSTSATLQAMAETDVISIVPADSGGLGYAEYSTTGSAPWTKWRPGNTVSQAQTSAGRLPAYYRFTCLSGSMDCDITPRNHAQQALNINEYVPTARTSAAIQASHDEAAASGGGFVVLEAGATYIITTPLVFEASKVGIKGNLARLDCSGLAAATVGLTLTNTSGEYMLSVPFENFYIIGNIDTGRDFNATAIRLHTTTALSDVRAFLRGVFIRYFNTGISIGSQAFLSRFEGVEILQCKFCVLQENVSSTYTLENVNFNLCAFYNSDCFLKSFIGQQFHFQGCSFDFFGGRQTSDDRAFHLAAGTIVELSGGSHIEFNYGTNAGDTNCPIKITGANSKFIMHGGSINYGSTAQNPAWTHFIETDNQSQEVIILDTQFTQMGRKSAPTADDALIRGSVITSLSGNSAKAKIRVFGEDNTVDQLPAVIGYMGGGATNPFIHGVTDIYTELAFRTKVTSTVVISSAGAENSITPKDGAAVMMKIVRGATSGKAIINLPTLELMRIHAWGLFYNAGFVTGSCTVKERISTFINVFDETTVSQVLDTRASNAANTVTITGGTNVWKRISWKDVLSAAVGSPRKTGDMFAIEIDMGNVTGGALYLCSFAMDII